VDETWALALGDEPGAADRMPSALRGFVRGPHAPFACLHLGDEESVRLGAGNARWLLRIGGNASATAAAQRSLRALGPAQPIDGAVWDRLRAARHPEARALRWRWDTLSRRLKATFDPRNVLNPGLLGDAA
jgi:hypothetical protein